MSFRTTRKVFTVLGLILLFSSISFAQDSTKSPVDELIKTKTFSIELSDALYLLGESEEPSSEYGSYYGSKGYYGSGSSPVDWVKLSPPDDNVKREYLVTRIGSGEHLTAGVNGKLMDEGAFLKFAIKILKGGSLYQGSNLGISNDDHGFYNKNSLVSFYKALSEIGILPRSAVKELAAAYAERGIIECAYALDDAMPGIMDKSYWDGFYFKNTYDIDGKALAQIKAGRLEEAGRALDAMLLEGRLEIYATGAVLSHPSTRSFLFPEFAFSYGELVKHGGKLSDDIQSRLLVFFIMNRLNNFSGMLSGVYQGYGLPTPTAEVTERALMDEELSRVDYVKAIVRQLRDGTLAMPVDSKAAAAYRDVLLRNYENIEDIEFLVARAREDGPVQLWHSYADSCWSWYRNKESRLMQRDTGDYFRAAVAGYKRVVAYNHKNPTKTRPIRHDLLDKMAEAAEEDIDVRMADLISVNQLRGIDFRDESSVRRLDRRIKLKAEQPSGAYTDPSGNICWYLDSNGVKIIPFRDAIELEAYLNDSSRINRLTLAVRRYFLDKFKIVYSQNFSTILDVNNQLNSNSEELQRIPPTPPQVRSPCAYADLDEIYRVYKDLNFKLGAGALGSILFEGGLVMSARRFFHLAGIGKMAEERIYSTKPDSYWSETEMAFVRSYQIEGIKQNIQK